MPKNRSKTSFRIRGLPKTLSKTEYELLVNSCLNAQSKPSILHRNDTFPWKSRSGMAHHHDANCIFGTVSMAKPRHKKKLLRFCNEQLAIERCLGVSDESSGATLRDKLKDLPQWPKTTDDFRGITVLSSPPPPEKPSIEYVESLVLLYCKHNEDVVLWLCIVVVHGLNGNAMDTFAHKPESADAPVVCWPRELLALDFPKARVMTYDYNAHIMDSENRDSDLDYWAQTMLQQIESHRSPDMKTDVPLVFIGYSYGGILTRETFAELHYYPDNYETLCLGLCGYMFLGTPHQGSRRADWADLSLSLATVFGLNRNLAKKLASFNKDLDRSNRVWLEHNPRSQRPIKCYCETLPTRDVLGRMRIIVSQVSATFIVPAKQLPNTDHHTICRFERADDQSYVEVKRGLQAICEALQDMRVRMRDLRNAQPVPERMRTGDAITVPEQTPSITASLAVFRFDLPTVIPKVIFTSTEMHCQSYIASHLVGKHRKPYTMSSKRELAVSEANSSVSNKFRASNVTLARSGMQEEPGRVYHGGTTQTNAEDLHHPARQNTQISFHEGSMTEEPRSLKLTAWERNAVLSLDGGGLRGYSSLLVLEALMKEVRIIERKESRDERATEPPTSRTWTDRAQIQPMMAPVRTSSILSLSSLKSWSSGSRATGRSLFQPPVKPLDEDEYLPCHYFDYVVGAGTGGLIATMLGRLRMSTTECLNAYNRIFSKILRHNKGSVPRYSLRSFDVAMTDLVNRHTGTSSKFYGRSSGFSSPRDLCKTIVIANDAKTGKPRLFRSYDHQVNRQNSMYPSTVSNGTSNVTSTTAEDSHITSSNTRLPMMQSSEVRFEPATRNPGPADPVTIVEVTKAATAEASRLTGIEINGRKYHDASLGSNNPSFEALQEILAKNGGNNESIHSLISIGCGSPESEDKDKYFSPARLNFRRPFRNRALGLAFDSSSIHQACESVMLMMENSSYYRLDARAERWNSSADSMKAVNTNVEGNMSLLQREVHHTLQNEAFNKKLKACARQLVLLRRERAQTNVAKWERFSQATSYLCKFDSEESSLVEDLQSHMRRDHKPRWDAFSHVEQKEYLKNCKAQPIIGGGPGY